MPLYLVRWPNLSCALVRAHNRAEVLDILDEVANPDGVEVKRYDGPVFVDFTLATDRPLPLREGSGEDDRQPLSEQDIEVGDVQELAEGALPEVLIPETDTGYAMYRALLAGAFPHLHRVLVAEREEETADVEQVRAAAATEALALVRASWRRALVMRSSDPVSIVAQRLGTSPEHIRNLQHQTDDGRK